MILPDHRIATILQQSSLHLSAAVAAAPTLPTLEGVSPALGAAEILKEAAHILGDVVPFLGAPTFMFRLSMLLGRIFSMESHYISDKVFATDDLFFDLPLLGLSVFLVWRSMFPILQAALSAQPSALEKVAFGQLFEPVGINWIQFRVMLTTCLDWVSLEPGQVLEGGETEGIMEPSGFENATSETSYLYWLYEGDVTGYYEGNFLTNIERHDGKSINDPSAVGLLADMKFLYNLDLKQKMKTQSDVEVVKYPMATFRVGKRGATLMRIEADRLYDLMEHDEHLEASIRELLLKSLQRKVGLLLRSTGGASAQPEKNTVLEECDEQVGLPHELSI